MSDSEDSDDEPAIQRKTPVAASSKKAPAPKSSVASKASPKTTPTVTKRKVSAKGKSYKEDDDDDDDEDDDDEYSDDDFDIEPSVKRRAVGQSSKPAAKKSPAASRSTKAGGSKAKPMEIDDDEDDEDEEEEEESDDDVKPKSKGKAKAKSPAAKKPAAKKSPAKKKEKEPAKIPTDDVVEGISLEEAANRFVAEIPKGEDGKKPNYFAMKAKQDAGPVAPGSKEIPQGAPNCLAPYTMVFTGELTALSRQEATDLAKRYGAKVTTAPSSKTTHVVMGHGAGASKIKKIKEGKNMVAKIIDEDGFLELIRKSKPGQLDEKALKKIADEEKKIKQVAAEMQERSTQASTSKAGASGSAKPGALNLGASVSGAGKVGTESDPSGTLWTTKYAPRKMKDLVGNKSGIEKLQNWLTDWPKNLKANFKKPGKDAYGIFRAVLISGNPGIGKTSAAHLVSRSLGYTPLELNASDARSKKLIELALKDAVNNTNLQGWFHGGAEVDKNLNPAGVKITNKTVLIMDEIDGMSGGDRGGVGAINALIKKTRVPIICICNEARSPKLKPLEPTTFSIKFRKPEAPAVKSRMMSLAFSEKMKIPPEVMGSLVEASQGDIRLMINMLSTWALSQKTMDYDESKKFGEANMKPGMHTPFTLFSELAGPYSFSATSRKTLNDMTDYYFQDPSLMPLLMQENYLKQLPSTVARLPQPDKAHATLDLMANAAESISDADVIDGMIHGPQQHWSLMPQHGIASCVRPAFFTYGQNMNHFPAFPSWLGQNSKAMKLRRLNTDIQTRMRLAASASADEVRLVYQPVLLDLLVDPLVQNPDGGIQQVIDVMDEYFLGIDDRDAIIELGIGRNSADKKLKGLESSKKAAFTKKYNSSNHPVAFYKAVDVANAGIKVLKGDAAPDVEEAFQEDEEPEDDDDKGDEEPGLDKNKLVKEVKPKAKGGAAAKGKGKAKAK